MPHEFQHDIDAIARIDIMPTILDVVCRTTGMGFVAVARVTEDRWIACQVLDKIEFGLVPGGELEVQTTICSEIRDNGEPVVIDHVAEDNLFATHHTPLMYGFQSYISMPIIRQDGSFFGTLCAIDPRPARLKNPETIGMFRLFAQLIAFHLEAGERLAQSQATLNSERQVAELREQFIAVLGHDLRNPLAAIDSGIQMLKRSPLDARGHRIIGLMQGAANRMDGLITNVLDFARGRMGGGLTLKRQTAVPLSATLMQIVNETRAQFPERAIEADIRVTAAVNCDPGRISQMLSNLLGNALMHGAEGTPVRVDAATDGGQFELSVTNSGLPIPADSLARLFEPYYRGQGSAGRSGLGLGLYIASEIARAHGGTLEVASTESQTRFSFRMPVA